MPAPSSGGTDGSPRAPSHWQRRVTEALTQRLALKGTAILLSVVLWFIVSAREPTEDFVRVRFVPTLDSSLVLRDPPPPIFALVSVSGRRDLLKLNATPPVIRREISASTPDTIVIDLQVSDVELPPGTDAQVRDVQPKRLTLRFEPTSSRVVAVRSAVLVAADSGTTFDGPMTVSVEPESVEVSGPRQRILGLMSVTTVKSIIPAGDSLPHLVDIDTAGLGVRVRPGQVKVQLAPSRPATLPPVRATRPRP
jgi:hypothetical protein